MVRDPKTQDELIESSRDTATSPEQRRAPRRSFVFAHTAIANPDITRDIVVRADADFEPHLRLGVNERTGRRSLCIRAPLDP